MKNRKKREYLRQNNEAKRRKKGKKECIQKYEKFVRNGK
jgi:hypothetical protein